jgi:hypothetical protein
MFHLNYNANMSNHYNFLHLKFLQRLCVWAGYDYVSIGSINISWTYKFVIVMFQTYVVLFNVFFYWVEAVWYDFIAEVAGMILDPVSGGAMYTNYPWRTTLEYMAPPETGSRIMPATSAIKSYHTASTQ